MPIITAEASRADFLTALEASAVIMGCALQHLWAELLPVRLFFRTGILVITGKNVYNLG